MADTDDLLLAIEDLRVVLVSRLDAIVEAVGHVEAAVSSVESVLLRLDRSVGDVETAVKRLR